MVRKLVTYLVLVPLALVIVAFAVANREPVIVSFDPFDAVHPAFATSLPLFVLIFVLVIVGVVLGGIAAWMRQGKWRRVARRLESDVRNLHAENAALRRQLAASEPPSAVPAAHAPPPPMQLRPPAA